MPEIKFSVKTFTHSDQPRTVESLLLVWCCGWFDEKQAVFGELTDDGSDSVLGVREFRKVQGDTIVTVRVV